MKKGGFIYMLTNSWHTVLYTGVTACLERRLQEHRQLLIPGFTAKYNVQKLVYYEFFEEIQDAIAREKYLKGKTRAKKNALIHEVNPLWLDLSDPSSSCASSLEPCSG